jgi:hypothetical protein
MVDVHPEEGVNMGKSLHEKTKEKVADSFELAQVFAQARVGEYPDNQGLVHMGDQLVRGLSDMLCQWEDFLEMIPPGASQKHDDGGQEPLPFTDQSYPDCHSRHKLVWQTRGRCIPDRRNPICRTMCGFGPVPVDAGGVMPESPVHEVITEHCACSDEPWTKADLEALERAKAELRAEAAPKPEPKPKGKSEPKAKPKPEPKPKGAPRSTSAKAPAKKRGK